MDLAKKLLVTELLIKKAYSVFPSQQINILWSGGKDSTVLIHIIKNIYKTIPFPVVFADSSAEFAEVYSFIDRLEQKWDIPLVRVAYSQGGLLSKKKRNSLRLAINKKHQFRLTLSGIRWYEHFHTANRFYSKGYGTKILYPLLHWTSQDIWTYIKNNKVPYVDLYKKGYLHLETKYSSVKQPQNFPLPD